jgi:hypothetical protein
VKQESQPCPPTLSSNSFLPRSLQPFLPSEVLAKNRARNEYETLSLRQLVPRLIRVRVATSKDQAHLRSRQSRRSHPPDEYPPALGVMIRTCGSFSAWWRKCGAPFRG